MAGSLSDRQLLTRFLDRADPDRSEAAFAELIERHGPMVLNVCERLLGDGQDAHDAFQATFLVLVRKGASVRKPKSLASWLFGIATRVARHARREAFLRRQRLERLADRCTDKYQFASSPPDLVAEPAWPALYEEMDRLPEVLPLPPSDPALFRGSEHRGDRRQAGLSPGHRAFPPGPGPANTERPSRAARGLVSPHVRAGSRDTATIHASRCGSAGAGHHSAQRRACCWPEPHSRRLRVSRSFRSHSERCDRWWFLRFERRPSCCS